MIRWPERHASSDAIRVYQVLSGTMCINWLGRGV